MKIKRFNESFNWTEDDKIPFGYKYSWGDIFDMVVDLIDLGFEVVKNDRYFINENDKKIESTNRGGSEKFYKDVKGTCYILKMVKDISLFNFYDPGYGYNVSNYKFHKSSDNMLKILEIISYIEKREKVYHGYNLADNKISLILMIQSDIVEGFAEKKIKELREYKIRKNIQDIIISPRKYFLGNKDYTKKFREEAFGQMEMDIWIGEDDFFEKSEISIYPINLNFTKQVLSSNMNKLEKDVNWFINRNKKRGINVEWRKITKQEAEKVNSLEIEGMMGMIFKYNISKLKKYVSDKIDKGDTWGI